MFLSSCELNPVRRGAKKLLGSPQAMHAAVMSCFPRSQAKNAGRVLWRLDQTRDSTIIYIVSALSPDFTALAEQAGWPQAQSWRTIPYQRVLDNIADGDLYSFRLTANPTHSVRGDQNESKRFGHVTAGQQEQWLLDRAVKNGFEIPTVGFGMAAAGSSSASPERENAFQVIQRGTLSFRRRHDGQQSTVTLRQATYSGVLRVSDTEKLRTALCKGIGPAKAYGCGLLTLAKAPTGQMVANHE